MRLVPVVLSFTISALAACSSGAPPVEERSRSTKPSAPVELVIDHRDLGNGRHALTLSARVTRDVDGVELAVAGQRLQFGATRAGERVVLDAQVDVPSGGGKDVVGSAWTTVAGQRRNADVIVRVGAPAPARPAPPMTIVTLPDGTQVAEARP